MSNAVLVVLLGLVGASTNGCGVRKGLDPQQTGGAGSTASAAGTSGGAGSGEPSGAAGTTGAAGTSGAAGTTGAAGTSGFAGTTGAAGMVVLAPLDGNWSKVAATPGCGRPAGQPLQTFVRNEIPTMGTKPVGCADSKCGPWSYVREYFLRLPSDYDATKAYPIVFEGPGCGGKGNNLYNNQTLGTLAIRVGLSPPPNDIGHATNPNQGCFDDREGDDSIEWVFYENLYDKLAGEVCFDRNRVFAAGNSTGARLANELGCKYAGDVLRPVRGVMPRAGGLPDPKYQPTCSSKPLAGVWVQDVGDLTYPFAETAATITRAMRVSGCTIGTGYDTAQFDPFAIGSNANSCKRIKGCPVDVPLVVCPLPGNNSHGSSDDVVNPAWVAFVKLFAPTP